MDDINPAKDNVKYVESAIDLTLQELPLPEELRHLDRGAIHALDKKVTKHCGLPKTLHITNEQYNNCLMIFDIGYVITQIPSNLLITRKFIRPSIYICSITASWGIVSMCQGFTRNYIGLFVSRFILGLVEAPFLPGVFLLMSTWYTRAELAPPTAFLYGANMLASAFGGLIAAGIIAKLQGVGGRPAWEWLFIIEGSMTVGIAILVMPFLPDYPMQTMSKWLPRELQLMAQWRIENENTGIPDEDPKSLWWGLKQALIDPKLYMFIVLQIALITAQSFNNF